MILTGLEIKKELVRGNIIIDPFFESNINPNSYNYRLGKILKILHIDEQGKQIIEEITIPAKGLLLKKGQLYLGNTMEKIGSSEYSMRLIGRSSIGRYGLFMQISADLGHVGSSHRWTLEIVPSKDIIVYPEMKIGQVSFWENFGSKELYQGYYGKFNVPKESGLA